MYKTASQIADQVLTKLAEEPEGPSAARMGFGAATLGGVGESIRHTLKGRKAADLGTAKELVKNIKPNFMDGSWDGGKSNPAKRLAGAYKKIRMKQWLLRSGRGAAIGGGLGLGAYGLSKALQSE